MTTTAECVRAALHARRRLEFDNDGFSELVRRFQDLAFASAYSLSGDAGLAHDACQEAFIVAWRQLEQLMVPEAFPGWLRAIVRSVALGAMRRRDTGEIPLEETRAHATGPGPYQQAALAETEREVRTAIAALPRSLRESVELFYMKGCKLADVAGFLDISESAAKKRLERGRNMLRKNLEARIRDSVATLHPGRDDKLVESVNLYTNLEIAARIGQMSLIEALIMDGIDVNEPDATGKTLLHWAVENQHVEAVDLLLRGGADQHARDRRGVSPRHLAQESRMRDVMELLDDHR